MIQLNKKTIMACLFIFCIIMNSACANFENRGSEDANQYKNDREKQITSKDVLQYGKIVRGVSFRKGPSIHASRIRYLKNGETVNILNKVNKYWYKIKDQNGVTGYTSTSSKYIKVSYTESGNMKVPNTTNASGLVENVITVGLNYLGTPYEFGSSRSNTKTFDCSDFVRQAFLEGAGITLPADSRKQGSYVRGTGQVTTNWKNLKRGDLMFFSAYKGSGASNYANMNPYTERITHDGIYLGDGQILHTYSKASGGVRVDTIAGKHWEKRFLYGGSVIK